MFTRFFLILFVGIAPCLHGMTKEEFRNWWSSYRQNHSVPSELKQMEDHFIQSGLINHSSDYWNTLNKQNIEQIVSYGYKNFKQTVTRNYFTWVVSIDHGYSANLKKLVPKLTISLPKEELNKVHSLFTREESLKYNEITLYFLNYMVNSGASPYLEKLEEPLIGNPPCLTYKGKRISQDVMNSLYEYLSVARQCPLEKINSIVEIGAGSGRTAFCFMTLNPGAKYVIVDFPPALYLSQTYLTDVFPSKKIFRFRPFSSFESVASEFEEADLVFLTPDQIELLPDRSCDLFLSIDCLHEMKPNEIGYYFGQANRLSKYIYFKCWQWTIVPYDGDVYTADSYPVYSTWNCLFKEPCVVPSDFFHALYRIGK